MIVGFLICVRNTGKAFTRPEHVSDLTLYNTFTEHVARSCGSCFPGFIFYLIICVTMYTITSDSSMYMHGRWCISWKSWDSKLFLIRICDKESSPEWQSWGTSTVRLACIARTYLVWTSDTTKLWISRQFMFPLSRFSKALIQRQRRWR